MGKPHIRFLDSILARERFSESVLVMLTLVLAVFAFFWKLLFTNLILGRGDTYFYIYPYWTAAARALRNGRIPLWNPDLFMGAPFLANSQVGLFYPLNWPLWLALDTPQAASVSIGLHIAMGGLFTFYFAKNGLYLSRTVSWFSGCLFALGGYLTAQVEHVNQLQGLIWLPAVLTILSTPNKTARRTACKILLLALVFALQLLAGHTQAAFITAVGGGIFALWITVRRSRVGNTSIFATGWIRKIKSPIFCLLIAGLMSLALAAIQIFPTQELVEQSIRSGGLPLNEAVSFSLHPLLVGKAILPGYGETLFSEYTAFLPLGAIFLAIFGLKVGGKESSTQALALMGFVGLFFAFGRVNPFYVLIAKYLPGFGLFRVPARWLVLYAFGMAGLAGIGLEALVAGKTENIKRVLIIWAIGVGLLIVGAFVAPYLTVFFPDPPESPVSAPSMLSLCGWLVEIILVLMVVWASTRRENPKYTLALIPMSVLVLFVASRALPYNHPTTPDAYQAFRPATAFLKAASQYDARVPPDRFLSISEMLFEPGDKLELEAIYGDQLDGDGFYDLLIASKQKEILAPNLSMAYAIPSVDGYDGGVLPLANYITMQHLLVEDSRISMDGRLRENIGAVPESRWLNLFNARYVITDKVGDTWIDGVHYDLQHKFLIDDQNPELTVSDFPNFKATGLGIVLGFDKAPEAGEWARIFIEYQDGYRDQMVIDGNSDSTLELDVTVDDVALFGSRVQWTIPRVPVKIMIDRPDPTTASALSIHALSLFNTDDGSFQNVIVSENGNYQLVHSGDVKIYENRGVLPRAFLVGNATRVSDDAKALAYMRAKDFNPTLEVVLIGSQTMDEASVSGFPGKVTITSYAPELVELSVAANDAGWLVLGDAYYPGWVATVDDIEVPIERADLLFRAIAVPSGTHQVRFVYQPASVRMGAIVSGLVVLIYVSAGIFLMFIRRSAP